MKSYNEILATEYSPEFDKIRKDMMVQGFYSYGSIKKNQEKRCTDLRKSIDKRLKKFDETKNTEYLADVANLCMGIYMFPEAYEAHYEKTDSDKSPGLVGMSVEEIKRFQEEHY